MRVISFYALRKQPTPWKRPQNSIDHSHLAIAECLRHKTTNNIRNEQLYLLGVVKIVNSFIYFHCIQHSANIKRKAAKHILQNRFTKFLLISIFLFSAILFLLQFYFIFISALSALVYFAFHFIFCYFCVYFVFRQRAVLKFHATQASERSHTSKCAHTRTRASCVYSAVFPTQSWLIKNV